MAVGKIGQAHGRGVTDTLLQLGIADATQAQAERRSRR
jgi:hypothetical protein